MSTVQMLIFAYRCLYLLIFTFSNTSLKFPSYAGGGSTENGMSHISGPISDRYSVFKFDLIVFPPGKISN